MNYLLSLLKDILSVRNHIYLILLDIEVSNQRDIFLS